MKSSSACKKIKPVKYEKKKILRMSGFYIAQNFLGAIGHLMRSTGVADILVEADVFLRGTANTIISGKD